MAYMDCPRMGGVRLVDWWTDALFDRLGELKNKEMFQIAPVEGQCMEHVRLVDWCIC